MHSKGSILIGGLWPSPHVGSWVMGLKVCEMSLIPDLVK